MAAQARQSEWPRMDELTDSFTHGDCQRNVFNTSDIFPGRIIDI